MISDLRNNERRGCRRFGKFFNSKLISFLIATIVYLIIITLKYKKLKLGNN
jgi:hypothetical protein